MSKQSQINELRIGDQVETMSRKGYRLRGTIRQIIKGETKVEVFIEKSGGKVVTAYSEDVTKI